MPSPFRFDRSWHFGVSLQPLLRSFARIARPAMAWAHGRTVEHGLMQFEGHALRERDRLA